MSNKVLTIKLPWAWQVITGTKLVEHRSWRTSYRGRLWIHSAVADDARAPAEQWDAGSRACPRGMILGYVELLDVIPEPGGRWGWQLGEPRLMLASPVSARGLPGLWRVPEGLS